MVDAADALDRDRQELTAFDELREEGGSPRPRRPVRLRRARTEPEEDLALPRRAQQAVGPVPAEQPVEHLLALGNAFLEEARREEALREVVEAAVALASGDAEDARLGERFEDRPGLQRGPPVPVDRLAAVEVGGGDRAVAPDPLEELHDMVAVVPEDLALVGPARPIPGQAMPRQLPGGQDAQALVVGLEQEAPVVEQVVCPGPPVAPDAGMEHEVVVAAGHLERVELQRAETVDDREHALLGVRQRPRRGEEMADDQEAPRDGGGERARDGHGTDRSRSDRGATVPFPATADAATTTRTPQPGLTFGSIRILR